MKPTIAALAAFAKGDMDNFVTASTPGGIEAQEKAGQTTFVANSQLPKECPRKDLEKMGFKFGADVSALFVSVTMPAGWKKVATEHSMWSDLLDDKGRKRAGIFYKAAFYDQRADMHLERRYNVQGYHGCEKDGKSTDPKNYSPPYFACVITDAGKEIHRIGIRARDDHKTGEDLDKEGRAWLNANFPLWDDVTAYWE